MPRTLGKVGVCVLVVLALVTGAEGAPAATDKAVAKIQGIQHESTPTHIRVVVELDQRATYTCNTLPDDASKGVPPRIYLDLARTGCCGNIPKTISFIEGPLKAVRIGQYDNATTRVVLDVRKVEQYKVSILSSPDRIVVDLWTEKVKDTSPPSPFSSSARPTTSEPSVEKKGERPEKAFYVPRIVIDPGHGGHDPGAVGKSGLMEKDVALRLAKLVKARLERNARCEVFLTRTKDIYLPLGRRTAVANAKKADLFISIHANAHSDRCVSGIETYYLDNTTDKAAIRLAALENASSGHNESDLQRILLDLRRNSNVLESNALAHIVQGSLVGELRRGFQDVTDHGAKANLFYVLMGADMPSILVEVSFITNREEERRLKHGDYVQCIAGGIQKGISQYISKQYLPTLQAQR